MSEVQEQTEKKPLTGIAAYHERKRLEKEQAKGIQQEKRALKQEEEVHQVTPINAEEIDFGIDPSKTYRFEVIEKSKTARHQILSNSCKIFDQGQNRVREIKYIPVADTIFVDEMGDRYKGYPDTPLSFHNNELIAEGSDMRLVEYMLSHDKYDGNQQALSKTPPLFTLVNKADLEDKREKEYSDKVKAMNAINESDMKDLMPIARVVFNIMDIDPKAVKNKLRDRVETQYLKILANIDSPKVKRSFLIQSALDQGIIEVNTDKRSLVWGGTGTLIKEMNAFRDSESILSEVADFSFTNDGNKVYDILKQKVKM